MEDQSALVRQPSQPAPPALPPTLHGDAELMNIGRPKILTSLDMTSEDGRRALAAALSSVELSGREAINLDLLVTDFVYHTSKRRSFKDKELEPCMRLVLLTKDRHTWATTSEWAIESFFQYAALIKFPPWPDGVKFQLREVDTSGGFKTYKLFPDVGAKVAGRTSKKPADAAG